MRGRHLTAALAIATDCDACRQWAQTVSRQLAAINISVNIKQVKDPQAAIRRNGAPFDMIETSTIQGFADPAAFLTTMLAKEYPGRGCHAPFDPISQPSTRWSGRRASRLPKCSPGAWPRSRCRLPPSRPGQRPVLLTATWVSDLPAIRLRRRPRRTLRRALLTGMITLVHRALGSLHMDHDKGRNRDQRVWSRQSPFLTRLRRRRDLMLSQLS